MDEQKEQQPQDFDQTWAVPAEDPDATWPMIRATADEGGDADAQT